MITSLEDFRTYHAAMSFGEEVWALVSGWRYFEKDTVGKQLVKSADSIASNLSEGLGRYHYRETKNFAYYSRGSLFETKTWLTKAHARKLLKESEFETMIYKLDLIGKMINAYIKSVGNSNPSTENCND